MLWFTVCKKIIAISNNVWLLCVLGCWLVLYTHHYLTNSDSGSLLTTLYLITTDLSVQLRFLRLNFDKNLFFPSTIFQKWLEMGTDSCIILDGNNNQKWRNMSLIFFSQYCTCQNVMSFSDYVKESKVLHIEEMTYKIQIYQQLNRDNGNTKAITYDEQRKMQRDIRQKNQSFSLEKDCFFCRVSAVLRTLRL